MIDIYFSESRIFGDHQIRCSNIQRPALSVASSGGQQRQLVALGMADASSCSGAAEKGAAKEPEPEPGEPPSTTAAAAAVATYDPREYQPAHPDDRGVLTYPARCGERERRNTVHTQML